MDGESVLDRSFLFLKRKLYSFCLSLAVEDCEVGFGALEYCNSVVGYNLLVVVLVDHIVVAFDHIVGAECFGGHLFQIMNIL